jgi:hypothetical protein
VEDVGTNQRSVQIDYKWHGEHGTPLKRAIYVPLVCGGARPDPRPTSLACSLPSVAIHTWQSTDILSRIVILPTLAVLGGAHKLSRSDQVGVAGNACCSFPHGLVHQWTSLTSITGIGRASSTLSASASRRACRSRLAQATGVVGTTSEMWGRERRQLLAISRIEDLWPMP